MCRDGENENTNMFKRLDTREPVTSGRTDEHWVPVKTLQDVPAGAAFR